MSGSEEVRGGGCADDGPRQGKGVGAYVYGGMGGVRRGVFEVSCRVVVSCAAAAEFEVGF